MVSSPLLLCCSPRRPLLMLSLACRLDTHAAVAVRRRTSLLTLVTVVRLVRSVRGATNTSACRRFGLDGTKAADR